MFARSINFIVNLFKLINFF